MFCVQSPFWGWADFWFAAAWAIVIRFSSGINRNTVGSGENRAASLPRRELQLAHATTRLVRTSRPPQERGTMCSSVARRS